MIIRILNLWFLNEDYVDNIFYNQDLICLQLNGLVWFYGISNILGYSMANLVSTDTHTHTHTHPHTHIYIYI